EHPDLIVFIGDNVTGGRNRERLKEFCDFVDSYGIYWCPILGNHEGDNPLSEKRRDMVKKMSGAKFCLLEADDKTLPDGRKVGRNGNYAIHLCNKDSKIFETLFFIDTGSDMTPKEVKEHGLDSSRSYDAYILPTQIEWYRGMVEKQGKGVRSVVFGHIPLPEFKLGYELATDNDREYSHENGWISGYRRENVCCSPVNTGMFSAMLESDSTYAYFAGHDHINDFIVTYKGIMLGYNLPGNYSSYNIISKKEKPIFGGIDYPIQGYNIYTFSEDRKVSVKPVMYHNAFPELRDEVMSIIRKK
nr:metallophosphoesterase [Lachnospiraceae bacterium]